jgi:hypothetical protein
VQKRKQHTKRRTITCEKKNSNACEKENKCKQKGKNDSNNECENMLLEKKVGLKLELGPLFIMVLGFFRFNNGGHNFFLLLAYTLNPKHEPLSYPYSHKDLISTLISNF